MPAQAMDQHTWRDRLSTRIAVASIPVLACAAVVTLAWLSLARSREQYQHRAEITAQNLCVVLADDLITSYEKIDLAVLGVKDEIEQHLASRRLDAPRIEAFIKRQRSRIPGFSALRGVNAQGLVEFGNDVSPGTRIDLSDRDYFQVLKADPGAGLVFSKPLMGRVRHTWVLMLARRLNHPDGSFAGMVYGTIVLEQLASRFTTLSIGREGTIALRDADLTVIVRHGGAQDMTGQSAISQEFKALVKAGRTSGTYTAINALDGVPRIHYFLKLEPYGQYLSVGLGRAEAFEPWRRERRQTIGFVALIMVVLGAASWMAASAWMRRRSAEAERERVIQELQGALAEVNALSGLLPICSHCKKIRDDNGYWNQIEAYLVSHSEAQFTHGICPECAARVFPEVMAKRRASSISPEPTAG